MPRDDTKPTPRPGLRLGTREIGPSHPVYVIAEVGVNHNGRRDAALELIDAAYGAGADAVKFQMFDAAALTTGGAPAAAYQVTGTGSRSQRDMLARLELGDHDFAAASDACRDRGLDFLATPFTERDVERLARLNPPAIKIASTDITDVPLIEAASRLGKPMIVSTGGATLDEIADACLRLDALGVRDRTILMHCISAYPAPLDTLNLRAIATLARTLSLPVGFSDHAADTRTGAWAVAAGAVVMEKHLTLDASQDGPDHAMSLEPRAFARYVGEIRDVQRARGDGAVACRPHEAEVRDIARKSVVAARAIPADTVITKAMLAVKRPGVGLAPAELDALVGRKAGVHIASDTLLSWDMVQ